MDGAPKTSHQPQSTCFLILVSSPEYSDFIFLLEGITEKPRMPHLDLNLLFGIYLLHGDLRDSLCAYIRHIKTKGVFLLTLLETSIWVHESFVPTLFDY